MGIGANSQERKIKSELNNCSYEEGKKDYLFNNNKNFIKRFLISIFNNKLILI